MKRIIIYLSILFLSFFPVAASAQGSTGGDKPDENGLFSKKKIKEFNYDTMRGILNLECFVTGEMTAQIAPVDVVLVLDVSGSMKDEKLVGLKNGCSVLLDELMGIVDNGGDVKIGIVTFATESAISQNMTNLNSESIGGMKDIINGLKAEGETDMMLGLENANTLLNTKEVPQRHKITIFFTDGKPERNNTDITIKIGRDAINSAYKLKQLPGEVFSIGLFPSDPATLMDFSYGLSIYEFLMHLSSNYPRVQTLTWSGSTHQWLDINGKPNNYRDYSGIEYYSWAQTPDDLANIFSNIGSTVVSKSKLPLESKAVVKDVMSPECDFPEGTVASDIKVYSAPCTGGNDEDGYTFGACTEETDVVINVSSKSVSITGFDYGENWVGWNSSTGQYQGTKLIMEIPFEFNASTLIGKDISKLYTNDKSSGIYLDNSQVKPFEEFEVPEVEFINIIISETGLVEEESSIFVVESKSSDETSFTQIATLALTANTDNPGQKVSKKIMYLDKDAEYRVSRLGTWSWTYSNTEGPSVTRTDKIITFDFTNEKIAEIPTKYKERKKDNDFRGDGTLTPNVEINPWNKTHKKRVSF